MLPDIPGARKSAGSLRLITAANRSNREPKLTVMLPEMVETETGLAVKLHLWRCDLLTGSIELVRARGDIPYHKSWQWWGMYLQGDTVEL